MNPGNFLVVAALIATCSAHMTSQDSNPQYYCGRSLARAIAVMCYEQYQDNLTKRTDGTMYNTILSPYYKDQEGQYSWPWLAPHKTRGMSLAPRGKRLVVNECCDKACSINELLSYC